MLYEERKHTALLNCVRTGLYKSIMLMKHCILILKLLWLQVLRMGEVSAWLSGTQL